MQTSKLTHFKSSKYLAEYIIWGKCVFIVVAQSDELTKNRTLSNLLYFLQVAASRGEIKVYKEEIYESH